MIKWLYVFFILSYSIALHQAFTTFTLVTYKVGNVFERLDLMGIELLLFVFSAIIFFSLYKYKDSTRINFFINSNSNSNSNSNYSKYFVPIVLLISFCLRMLTIIFFDTYPTMDAYQYFMDGIKIAEGGYFSDATNVPYWPAGYKIFIGILFFVFPQKLFVIKFAQVILHLIAELIMYKIVLKLSNNNFLMAKITLLLMAIYPNHILYSALIWSEILFLTMILLAFYLLILANEHELLMTKTSKKKYLILFVSGLLWGAAALVRPLAMFYPFAFYAAFFLCKKISIKISIKQLLVVFVAFFLMLSPWVYRNYKLYNKFILISTNGSLVLFMTFVVDNDGNKLDEMVKPRGSIDPNKLSDYALKYMMDNPYRTVKIMFRSFKKFYKSDFDGVESIIQSKIPKVISENDFNKILEKVHTAINLVNLKDVFVFEKNSNNYILKENLPEITRANTAQTILYSFSYPYWFSENLPLILIRFINSMFYYFTLFANGFLLFMLIRKAKHSRDHLKNIIPLYTLGLFFILINTAVYVMSQGDTRYHFPLMPWLFVGVSMVVLVRACRKIT
ncbi:MAG: glycosyltransferase family 39 protein [Oligoflexia bacterium]|nr:glycosyltransferase family 39 protein [Oligoflexia bacterium]